MPREAGGDVTSDERAAQKKIQLLNGKSKFLIGDRAKLIHMG